MDLQRHLRPLVPAAALAVILFAVLAQSSWGAAKRISFQDEVQPILKTRCLECHQAGGEGLKKSGMDLTTYEGLMKGTKHGPIIVPGDAFMSNLIAIVSGRVAPPIRMPHNKNKLTSCEIDLLRRWVNQNAKNN